MIMADIESNARRNERWYQEHAIKGRTLREIAAEEGVSSSTVSEAIKAVRASIPTTAREDAIRDVLEFYDRVRNEAWKIADLPPTPVFHPRTGEILCDMDGRPVYDYAGRLRALETAMKTVEHSRKVVGLDAAVKVENTITDQTAAQRVADEARKRLELDDGGAE